MEMKFRFAGKLRPNMKVGVTSFAGLLIVLFFGGNLWAHSQEAHAWIANEAVKFYTEQYGDHEILEYIGDNVVNPSDARVHVWGIGHMGCDWYDEKSWTGSKFLEGAWEEDTAIVWFNHFVAGGDGEELTIGYCLGDRSAYLQALKHWNGGLASPPASTVLGEYSSNKSLAYYYLGRIAHLLADMTVPAHTHNDGHGPGDNDFYEYTVSEYGLYRSYCALTGRNSYTIPRGTTNLYTSLRNLFGTTADYTEGYRSWGWSGGTITWQRSEGVAGDYDGKIPNEYGGFLDTSIFSNRYLPYTVNDLTDQQLADVESAVCDVMADDLMPFAIEQTAALIRLFYKQVHDTGITNWTTDISTNESSPKSVSGSTITTRFTATHPSGVKKNGYTFKLSRKQGSGWVPVGGILTSQTDTVTWSSLSAGIYMVEVSAINGVEKTGSTIGYFTNMNVSSPGTNWQAATALGTIEGERLWGGLNLSSGSVHYYRFTMNHTGTQKDFAGILIKGTGRNSNNLEVSLGRAKSDGTFAPATGRWTNVSTGYNDNDLYPTDYRSEFLSLNGFGPGEYYIVVYGMSGLDVDEALLKTNVDFTGWESGEYSLYIRGPMVDSFEVDDTPEAASTILTDGSKQHHSLPGSDIDWVTFQVNQLSEVSIATDVVIGDLNTNDLGLRIRIFGPDSSSSLIAMNYDSNGNARINRQGDNSLMTGIYYVRVESDTVNDIRDYIIAVTAIPRVLPNHSPAAPNGVTPDDGETGVSLTPTLECSAFSDWDLSDSHYATQWQVASDSNFTSLVWDSGETTVDKNMIAIPTGNLNFTTTYYWRVRHQDSSGISNSWSSWSIPLSFSTKGEIVLLPSVSVTPINAEVSEAGGSGIFRITRTENIASLLNVYFIMNGSAIAGEDYVLDKTSPVTIPAGESYVDVILTALDDDRVECTETATLIISTDSTYFRTDPNNATISILDSEEVPNADINDSDGVGISDFAVLASKWLTMDCNCVNEWCGLADINHSGTVDIDDLLIMAEHWLEGTTVSSKIAIINPDHYRVLKCGVVAQDSSYYSVANGSVADGASFYDSNAVWSGVGQQQDFIGAILGQVGCSVEYFEASQMPNISLSDYSIIIVQDPLKTNVLKTDKVSVDAGTLPDLLEYVTDSAFTAKIDSYIQSGGNVVLVGDAVRLLENGVGRLNYGKTILAQSPANIVDQASSWIPSQWLFVRGNPFCGRDRIGNGVYSVVSGELLPAAEILANVYLNNRSDLPFSHVWSDTVYIPTDAVSLLNVNFTGQGKYVLVGSTCNPITYNDSVNVTFNGFVGYTEHNNRRVYYLGSDSFFDYDFQDWLGKWHTAESMEIKNTITLGGKNTVISLLNYIYAHAGSIYRIPLITPPPAIIEDRYQE